MPDSPSHYQRNIMDNEIVKLVGRPDPIILEIGSNDGADTVRFLDLFPECTIHCFEIEPRAITAWFHRGVDDSRVKLYVFPLSDALGIRPFHGSSGVPPAGNITPRNERMKDGEWDMSGSLKVPHGHLDMSKWTTFPPGREYFVFPITLDLWFKTFFPQRIDFVWMDAQGSEADIITGGQRAFARARWLHTECYDKDIGGKEVYKGSPKIADLLASLPNWELAARYWTDNVLFRNTATGD